MAERTYLVARWIRIWHWTNAALIVLLGLTGMSIHFADPALPLVDFALAVRLHNIAGVLLIGAYLFFVIANIVTGNWWQFVPKPPGVLQRIVRQAMWYGFGIFRGEPHPHEPSKEEHFNALQAAEQAQWQSDAELAALGEARIQCRLMLTNGLLPVRIGIFDLLHRLGKVAVTV